MLPTRNSLPYRNHRKLPDGRFNPTFHQGESRDEWKRKFNQIIQARIAAGQRKIIITHEPIDH